MHITHELTRRPPDSIALALTSDTAAEIAAECLRGLAEDVRDFWLEAGASGEIAEEAARVVATEGARVVAENTAAEVRRAFESSRALTEALALPQSMPRPRCSPAPRRPGGRRAPRARRVVRRSRSRSPGRPSDDPEPALAGSAR